MISSFVFSNANDEPISIQVDPWAAWYVLKKGEKIYLEIVAEKKNISPCVNLEESGNVRYLWILNSKEYYVILNGERIHYTKYLTNLTEADLAD